MRRVTQRWLLKCSHTFTYLVLSLNVPFIFTWLLCEMKQPPCDNNETVEEFPLKILTVHRAQNNWKIFYLESAFGCRDFAGFRDDSKPWIQRIWWSETRKCKPHGISQHNVKLLWGRRVECVGQSPAGGVWFSGWAAFSIILLDFFFLFIETGCMHFSVLCNEAFSSQ